MKQIRDKIRVNAEIDRKEVLHEDVMRVVRSEEAEAKLLQLFSDFLNGVQSMKYMLHNEYQEPNPELRTKLRKLAYAKLDILKEVVNEIFGSNEEEKERDE